MYVLGYNPNHKGYQCLTPDDRIVVSRHMDFDKNHFLYLERLRPTNVLNECVPTYVPLSTLVFLFD